MTDTLSTDTRDIDPEIGEHDDTEPLMPMSEWFARWFAPTVSRKLSGAPERGLIWCPQWWRHKEVAVRVDDLYHAFLAAEASEDGAARSLWWIHHVDPHLRVLLDGESGPMRMCSKSEHHAGTPALSELLVTAPPGWFDGLDR